MYATLGFFLLSVGSIHGEVLWYQMELEGKLNERFSPFGVWYEDLHSAKSQKAIAKIEQEVTEAVIYPNTSTHCRVVEFVDKGFGVDAVFVRFLLNITGPPGEEVGEGEGEGETESRSVSRYIAWQVTNNLLRQCPVFLRLEVIVDVPPSNVDKTWMLRNAVLVVIFAGCFVAFLVFVTTSQVCVSFWREKKQRLAKKVKFVEANLKGDDW
ncbi:uncharacterized protein LOC134856539 [Symsagittifera roscoffensis]|uniref:uncharacterized protein LOC134856539 n=1 Tax=Symsagittifera roscoffensis TaxID=84072 RepID=UPI00307C926F